MLCTDVTGTTYLVGQRQTSVGDYHFNERGFVVRVYENSYMEYSFNEYEDIEKLASTITETLKKELHMMEEVGIEKMEAPLIHEEKIEKSMTGEIGVDPTSVSPEEILGRLKRSAIREQQENMLLSSGRSPVCPCEQAFSFLKKGSHADLCLCRRNGGSHRR